jgi:uncharacterized surface protein with fasciclin (FAS1) repeats
MQKDIVDTAREKGFTILARALKVTDLDEVLRGEGPFTVFAPTNEAFRALPKGILRKFDNETLSEILKYHVVLGQLLAEDVIKVTELTTVQGEKIQVKVENGQVFINQAEVLKTDVMASNGVIHGIDAVLLPPSLMQKDIVDTAREKGFTILARALKVTDLDEVLRGEGPFTVFAPTNEAFRALPKGILRKFDEETLSEILKYHVVLGQLLAKDVIKETELTTFQGEKIQVKVKDGKVFINQAEVIETDVMASNGVIHAIDAVLIPPSLMPGEKPADVYVIHGIPGENQFPVDVAVDGSCALPNFLFGQVVGPLPLSAETHNIKISPANADNPCANDPAIKADVSFEAGENATIIAHLDADGAPTASKFVNNVSRVKGWQTRFVARHTAAAPEVDVKLHRKWFRRPVRIFEDVSNGQEGQTRLFVGRFNTQVFLAGTDILALESGFDLFKPRTLNIAYVVGSAEAGNLSVINQTINLSRK